MTSPVFAGVDGGGTKTAIVIVDQQGTELARAVGDTSNAAVVGHARAGECLRALIATTAAEAGISTPITRLWCGLSGSDRPEDHALLRPQIADLAHEIRMTNDAELAFGGLPNEVGVAMVSGTGSIAFGRNAAGERARASGWGHIFDDYGSGYDVARQALHAYSAVIDGYGKPTTLVARLTEHWQLAEPYALIHRVYDPATSKGDIARLSRIVVEEALAGDDVSREIIRKTANDLAVFADAVARKLGFDRSLDIAMVGGMLNQVPMFREDVLNALRANWTISSVAMIEDPALTAALALADSWEPE